MATECETGHPRAKASERSFLRAMQEVTEVDGLGGCGGLWGTCPLCKSTIIYRREAPPQEQSL